MTRWRAKRLYREALASYRNGYINGSQTRLVREERGETERPAWSQWDAEGLPAYSAGYEYGADWVRVEMDCLPLDVRARVLAKALEP